MIESSIKDYKEEVKIQFEKLRTCLEKNDTCDYSSRIEEIKIMISRSNPSLMFYGIYNAGKSSVLNAIFGEEVASVNDIPETHSVTKHDWRNYTLVDTPGLNAPVEGDEEVTLAEIKKHDIIMFVIDDSDSFDSDLITYKIGEIIKSGKPCLIVINRKNDSDKDKIMEIKSKMQQNIEHIGLNKQYEQIDFIDVDANAAIKAKQEDKEVLLQNSNILELEFCISNKLASVEGIAMLRVPIENMNLICDEMKEIVENNEKNENGRKIQELLDDMNYIKSNTLVSFKRKLEAKMSNYIDRIYNQMSNGNKADFDQQQCEEEINILINEEVQAFCEAVNVRNKELIKKWRLELNVETIEDEFEMDETVSGRKKEKKDDLDRLLDLLEKIPVPIPIPDPSPIPIPLPVVVKIIKGIKEFLFGSDSSSQEVDVDEINEKNREIARKRMLALQEMKNKITVQMENYSRIVENNFNDSIEKYYNLRKKELDILLSTQQQQSKRNIELLDILQEIKTKNMLILEELR